MKSSLSSSTAASTFYIIKMSNFISFVVDLDEGLIIRKEAVITADMNICNQSLAPTKSSNVPSVNDKLALLLLLTEQVRTRVELGRSILAYPEIPAEWSKCIFFYHDRFFFWTENALASLLR